MANNTILNAGSGGDTIATDDVGGGVKVPVSKIHTGAAGADGGAVTPSNPFPVAQQGATPAGANLIGVAVSPHSMAIYNGTTAVTPQTAAVNAGVSGDANVIVAGVNAKVIRVLSYVLVAAGAVSAKFRDFDGTSTYADLTGPMPLAANGGVGQAFSPVGHFETQAGHGLTLNLSAGVTVAGTVRYVQF